MLHVWNDQSLDLFTLQETSVAGCLQDAGCAGADAPPGRAHTDLSGGCWSGRAAVAHSGSPPQHRQMAETPDYLRTHSSIWDWQTHANHHFLYGYLLPSDVETIMPSYLVCNNAFPCSQTDDKIISSRVFSLLDFIQWKFLLLNSCQLSSWASALAWL